MASKRKETNTKVTSVRAEGEGGGSPVSSPSAVNTDRSSGQILSAACFMWRTDGQNETGLNETLLLTERS